MTYSMQCVGAKMLYTYTTHPLVNKVLRMVKFAIDQQVYYDPSKYAFCIEVDDYLKCIGVLGMDVNDIVHNAERERTRRS